MTGLAFVLCLLSTGLNAVSVQAQTEDPLGSIQFELEAPHREPERVVRLEDAARLEAESQRTVHRYGDTLRLNLMVVNVSRTAFFAPVAFLGFSLDFAVKEADGSLIQIIECDAASGQAETDTPCEVELALSHFGIDIPVVFRHVRTGHVGQRTVEILIEKGKWDKNALIIGNPSRLRLTRPGTYYLTVTYHNDYVLVPEARVGGDWKTAVGKIHSKPVEIIVR